MKSPILFDSKLRSKYDTRQNKMCKGLRTPKIEAKIRWHEYIVYRVSGSLAKGFFYQGEGGSTEEIRN